MPADVAFLTLEYLPATQFKHCVKAVAPASLAEGEMCVRVVLNDSTDSYVERFHNRTVRHGNGSVTGQVTYTLGSEGDDESQAGSGVGSIDVI